MQQPTNPEDFAAIAAAALIRNGADSDSVYYDEANFQLLLKDGQGRVITSIHLFNFFVQFNACENDQARLQVIHEIIEMTNAGAAGYPATLAEARSKLFIQIKPLWVFQQDYEVDNLMVGPHMAAAVVYDTGDNFLYVNKSILEDWGTTFEDAFEIAGMNLIALGGFMMATDKDNSFYHHEADDYFGAARCLCISTIENLAVDGDPIVAIPHRDHLIATGTDSLAGMRFILDCFNELKDEPGGLPPILLRPTDGCYEQYYLPFSHELHEQFLELEFEYMSATYDKQKDVLNSQFEQLVGSRKVADYFVGGDNARFSFCFITPHMVPCLIPKSEFVTFGDLDNTPVAIACWDTAMRVLSKDLEDLDVYPPRLCISKFPDAQQLADMGFEPLPDRK